MDWRGSGPADPGLPCAFKIVPCDVAAWPRQALHGAGLHWIAALNEHDGDSGGQPLQDLHSGRRRRIDHVRGGTNQRFRMRTYDGRIIAPGKTKVDPKVPRFPPSQLGKPLDELLVGDRKLLRRRPAQQNTKPFDTFALLRRRRKRPSGRAPKRRDKFPPSHR